MKQKISDFFKGRYGADALSRALLAVYLTLAILSLFIENAPLRAILNILALSVSVLMFYRMFSGRIEKREAENLTYLRLRRRAGQWILLHRNRWKYRKTHVYRRCPQCESLIRLPKRSGEHICDCPKCGTAFDVKIK